MLSVVIPAYNEARRIAPTLDRVLAHLRRRGGRSEILVVDDGSTDGTAAEVRCRADSGSAVRLIQLPRNTGKGAALRAGMAASRGRRVLFTDADLSTPIEDLARLEYELSKGADIAIGSRAAAGADVTRRPSPVRSLLGRGGNALIRALAVRGIRDTQCGFKLFEGALARRLFAECREDGFAIDVEALCLAQARFGAHIREVGVRWEHRAGSKVRWFHYAEALLDVVRIAARVRVGAGVTALLPARSGAYAEVVTGAEIDSSIPLRDELEQER